MTPARPGHHVNTGGGQPTPPTVPSMRHACDVEVPKRIAQAHSAVQDGVREEATVLVGRGGKGDDLKVVQHLWEHPHNGKVLQLPGESDIGGGWLLAGGDPEPDKSAGSLEEDDDNPDQRGE